ncbi:MAG: ribosomal protein S18-alanine N-acetyltransferase [candidate division NC10 bacterium]|nr:ribosomal protein S18-alanine N-acetyltransferase [candidate division NC10 bacterium]MDE2321667.1 ribosomal protein S18-alanine N-acetyltransferase [candidate division NC10 bacterium]
MRREDLPEVLVIESLSFAEPWTEEMFLHELSSERIAESLVARMDEGSGERIVGFLCAWIVSGELHINNIAVHPGYRGRGVASQLLDTMLGRAHIKGVTVGYLEVRASNEAAAALYKSYGFQPIGRRRNYYEHPREDAIVMRREPL